jgi:hypothetical protein
LVSTPHALRDGEVVHVGDTDLTFRAPAGAELPSTAPPEPPPPAPPTPAGPRVFRLVVEAGPLVGNAFWLEPPEVVVGRDPEGGVALSEPTVSWRHARLTAHGAAWTITDLGSTNGTRLDGRPIEPNRATPIDPGAEVRLGEVTLRFEVGD